MERESRHRAARHRRPLASQGFSAVLAIHFKAGSYSQTMSAPLRFPLGSSLSFVDSRMRTVGMPERSKRNSKSSDSGSASPLSLYLPKQTPDYDQRQRWKTFLRNHKDGIAAMDFIIVPTVRFHLLYAWFVIGHGRREIIHFAVTAHPTSSWVMQQLREAFPYETTPRFLIYDNDSIFSERVTESIKNIGIEPRRTAYYS